MYEEQSIQTPFGVTVFGSALMLVEPDFVILNFKALALKGEPREAFQEARTIAARIAKFLEESGVRDYITSQTGLSPTTRRQSGGETLLGYTANITFRVVLRDIRLMEDILLGVIECGSSEINSVEFQTSQLKQLRIESRKKAIAAAREKAEIYCEAAGVRLGKVIHIEDKNPENLGRTVHMGREVPIDDVTGSAFNPGSIPVGAAVVVAFDFLD